MRLTQTSDLWWKNAVVYCLDVETYVDGDGDGCGDFRGLIQQIDHLHRLGVTCIWLMPFYPSPDRDDGYDITDFYGVDPRLGTLGEFVEFVRTARDRGIRVIADLVVNHTSIEHPWFQQARSSPRQPLPRLVRLGGRAARRRPAGRDVPGQGDQPLAVRRGGRPVLPAPLLQVPARPQRREPRRPRRDRPDHRVLDAAGPVGLPGRRRAVPARDQRPGRRRGPARPARLPRRPALVPQPAQRRGRAARRGQPALRRHDGVLRQGRRRADDVLRLHRHAADVPVAGARRRGPARRGAARPADSRRRTRTGRRSCATTTS